MAKPQQAGLRGCQVLFITPLNKDYSLNEQAVRDEVEWCIQNGAHGIWPGGYIGEWTVLEEETKKRLYKICAEQAKGRLYISAGAHGINTLQCIRLANYAQEIGCDSAWISPPTPRKMTQDEIYGHYKMIHDSTTIPLGLYNTYPKGIYMRPSLVARIAELERVVTCKDAIGDICHIAGLFNECKAAIKEGFKILGVPYNMLPIMLFGGPGITSNNWDLAVALELYNAINGGDIKRACELQLVLNGSWPLLMAEALATFAYGSKVETSIIGYCKAKASLCMGIDMGPPMPPFAPASEAELKAIRESLDKLPLKVKPFQKPQTE